MQDKFSIDSHKIHYHFDRLTQWKINPLETYPIYIEISPVGNCNHRCITGDTLINTIDGYKSIKELVGLKSVPVYTYNMNTKEVFITDAINIRKVSKNEEIIRVWFTDGTHIDCTPDHKFLRIGLGRKKQGEHPEEAQYLKEGDRVRALRLNKNEKGYTDIVWGRYGKRKRYRLIMDYLKGYKLSSKEQVHHKDHNTQNDSLENLQYCSSAKEHSSLHPEISVRMKENNPTINMNPQWIENVRKAIIGKKRSLEQRLRYRESKLGDKNPNYKGLNSVHPSRIKEINHVVSRVEYLKERQDVYCMEVPATGWFFANDVLIKNCTFCAVDYIGYKVRRIETNIFKERITELATLGIKSIMFAGEGEPLLHPDIAEIINHTADVGIDVAITTNGTPLTKKFTDACLSSIKWIKVSCNAGDPRTYGIIHHTKFTDFSLVWDNLRYAISKRKEGTTIGVQSVLLHDNVDSLENLVILAKETGLDYAVIKPYSQHLKSETHEYEGIKYADYIEKIKKLESYSDDKFNVVARHQAMEAWDSDKRGYDKCYSTPYFWAYIMATGDVYGCSAYLLDERFKYGNINETHFKDIWLGDKRKASMAYVDEKLDISECRKNCRMHHVNKFLWDVKQGVPHKNFI